MVVRTVAAAASAVALLGVPGALSSQEAAAVAEREPEVARGIEFPLTLRSIMRGPELVGEAPVAVRWTDDGRWLYFRWRPGGGAWHEERELYRVPASDGEPELLSPEAADSLAPLFAPGTLSSDRRWRVSAVRGDLYLVDRRDLSVRRLTRTAEAERSPIFSASDDGVLHRRGDNLYLLPLDDGPLRQLTDIRIGPEEPEREAEGHRAFLKEQQEELFEHIRTRKLQEERREAERERREARRPPTVRLERKERLQDLAPTPDGRWALLTARRPAEDAKETMVPRWVTESGYTEGRDVRTKVGDREGRVRLGLLEVASGELTWLDLTDGADGPPDDEIPALAVASFRGWNDEGTHGLIFAVDFDYKAWRLYALEAESSSLTLLTSHRDSAWVNGPCFTSCIGWFPDDHAAAAAGPRAWYVSEETGYAHLNAVNADGTARRQLTSGAWEVLDVTMPEGRDRFLLHTSRTSPFDRHPWRLEFAATDAPEGPRADLDLVQVVDGRGYYDAEPSPDGGRLAVTVSRANRPPELFVADNRPGLRLGDLEQVTVSPTAEWLTFPWIEPEIVSFEAEDGTRVPARIYRPADLGAEPNGAGVIFVHGAGYLHNVHHAWSSYYREYMFHHLLAARGYTVLDIDYRGSAGYGRDWRTAIYRHMGGKDLSDQVDGAAYLAAHEGVDRERIGIYGGSYGGFITLMALFTADDTFRAGAALRSVTDWAHYNPWYTSRILNLPHEDEEAYRRSSPIYFAEGMGPDQHLLIAHGMVDDNVHFSDVVRLAQRLIELGKENWEMAVYPAEDHGFVEPSSWTDEYRRIYELFERTMGPDAPSPEAAGVGAGDGG